MTRNSIQFSTHLLPQSKFFIAHHKKTVGASAPKTALYRFLTEGLNFAALRGKSTKQSTQTVQRSRQSDWLNCLGASRNSVFHSRKNMRWSLFVHKKKSSSEEEDFLYRLNFKLHQALCFSPECMVLIPAMDMAIPRTMRITAKQESR